MWSFSHRGEQGGSAPAFDELPGTSRISISHTGWSVQLLGLEFPGTELQELLRSARGGV